MNFHLLFVQYLLFNLINHRSRRLSMEHLAQLYIDCWEKTWERMLKDPQCAENLEEFYTLLTCSIDSEENALNE